MRVAELFLLNMSGAVYREERQRRRTTDVRDFLRSVREFAGEGVDKSSPQATVEGAAKLVRWHVHRFVCSGLVEDAALLSVT